MHPDDNSQILTVGDFRTRLEELCPEALNSGRWGIAVSGGGDSLCLATLLAEVLGSNRLIAVHFNHKLRPEADAEAEQVVDMMARLGLSTNMGSWQDQPAELRNIQQSARYARYEFFAHACAEEGLEGLFMAHTLDDVAESFLMRAGRGSGLAGLAAMEADSRRPGLRVLRPLLDVRRSTLQATLTSRGQSWLEDPSNNNPAFLRPRIRALLAQMAESGLDVAAFAASARSLRRADDALEQSVEAHAAQFLRLQSDGTAEMDFMALDLHDEIVLRLMARALLHVVPAPMAPRTSKRAAALARLRTGEKAATLGGVKMEKKTGVVKFCKENNL